MSHYLWNIFCWLLALDVGGAMLPLSPVSLFKHCLRVESLSALCIHRYVCFLWPIAMFCFRTGMTHPPTSRNCEGNPQNSLTLLHFPPPPPRESLFRERISLLFCTHRESERCWKDKVIFPVFCFCATKRKIFHEISIVLAPISVPLIASIPAITIASRVHDLSRPFRDRTWWNYGATKHAHLTLWESHAHHRKDAELSRNNPKENLRKSPNRRRESTADNWMMSSGRPGFLKINPTTERTGGFGTGFGSASGWLTLKTWQAGWLLFFRREGFPAGAHAHHFRRDVATFYRECRRSRRRNAMRGQMQQHPRWHLTFEENWEEVDENGFSSRKDMWQ